MDESRIARPAPEFTDVFRGNPVVLRLRDELKKNFSNVIYMSPNQLRNVLISFRTNGILNHKALLHMYARIHKVMKFVDANFPKNKPEAIACIKEVFKNNKLPGSKNIHQMYRLDLINMAEYHVRFICMASGNYSKIGTVLAKRARMIAEQADSEETVYVPSEDQVVPVITVPSASTDTTQSEDKPKPVLDGDERAAIAGLMRLGRA